MRLNKTLFICLFVVSFQSLAQDGTGLWAGLSLKKSLGKKIDIYANAQSRFDEDISYLKTYFGELGMGFKLSKKFDLSLYYRRIESKKNENKLFKSRNRYYGDFGFNQKISKKITFENRLRYQHQFKDNDDGVSEFNSSYVRNKIGIEYNAKFKLTPEVSADFFYNIQDKILDQIRPKVGLAYKINKNNAVSLAVFKNIDLIDKQASGTVIQFNYNIKF